jgi:NAD dependent epimerase/dehydratase family enzyme
MMLEPSATKQDSGWGAKLSNMAKVCIAGATGFLGRALRRRLGARGDSVLGLGRSVTEHTEQWARWNPERDELDPAVLEGTDAVINLAGESLASGRWTAARKRQLIDSRVRSTSLVCERLAGLARPPAVLLNASAVGYYGARGQESVDEGGARGEGFLAELCERW